MLRVPSDLMRKANDMVTESENARTLFGAWSAHARLDDLKRHVDANFEAYVTRYGFFIDSVYRRLAIAEGAIIKNSSRIRSREN